MKREAHMKSNMVKKKNVVKKSWNTPNLVTLNVSKTASGTSGKAEHNQGGGQPRARNPSIS